MPGDPFVSLRDQRSPENIEVHAMLRRPIPSRASPAVFHGTSGCWSFARRAMTDDDAIVFGDLQDEENAEATYFFVWSDGEDLVLQPEDGSMREETDFFAPARGTTDAA